MSIAKMIGTPYEVLDCWGVAKEFYSLELGVELKHYYKDAPNDSGIANNLIYSNMGDFHKVEGLPKYGDIVLIKLMGIESHIAIFLGGGKILHTSKKTGCVIDNIYPKWEKAITGYFRIK